MISHEDIKNLVYEDCTGAVLDFVNLFSFFWIGLFQLWPMTEFVKSQSCPVECEAIPQGAPSLKIVLRVAHRQKGKHKVSYVKFTPSYSQSYLTKWTNLGIMSNENENA